MNLNAVTLIGRVTQDPISKQFGKDQAFTRFNLATNGFGKGKQKDQTEFHTVVTFGKLADICKEYLRKGRLVYVQGRLKTSRWEDDQKVLHTKTDVIANEMLLLDKHQASTSAGSDDKVAVEA